MAGFSSMFVIGSPGGFMGADGVNSIALLVLVGDGNRQWLEPQYVAPSLGPIGRLRVLIPEGPNHPDALLDACLAFFPEPFRECPSFREVEAALQDQDYLDFDLKPHRIPKAWFRLREEAKPHFANLWIWKADLVPVQPA
ncbi:MAG TPA: hypothetical protein PLQ97_11850 [Myxococcota bacterium]|mgnify:CR=1 FL=1|nr:hypothetical protein [Myxococcota bacterium]HQK51453.1 hypothetical protein [Myxococcota bacterium]